MQKFYFSLEAVQPHWKSEVARGRPRPRSFLTSQDQGKSFEYHIWGSKWPRQWLASGGLEWPRSLKKAAQPRGWNNNFEKSNFMHSPKIWANYDYWNPSKPHFFDQNLHHLWRPFWPQIWPLHTFFNWIWKLMSKLIPR